MPACPSWLGEVPRRLPGGELLAPWPVAFYLRPTAQVAMDLLGSVLLHRGVGGIVVETEAYGGAEDPASHASRGPTPRSEVMFGPGGHAYVTLTYGIHHCFNVVAHPEGAAGSVLIRALEPRWGLARMQERQPRTPRGRLASGPGRVCRALGLDLTHNRAALDSGELWVGRLLEGVEAIGTPAVGPRVGIRAAAEEPLRFVLLGNRAVSPGPPARPCRAG